MTVKQKDLDAYETLTIEAMNTTFYFAVSGCQMVNWKEIMLGWVHFVEKEWSRFKPNNELRHLNDLSIGERMVLSPPLFDCLQKAEEYRIKTGNLFSPYLLEQMHNHGYTHSFPFLTSEPTHQDMHNCSILAPFEFDFSTNTITRIANGQVDLGGIGKGYAVESAARWLKQVGEATSGMVDGGGDMTVWSNSEKVWKIGIAHPLKTDTEIAQIQLKNGSIATSNLIYRSWNQGSIRKHHLLNGRTGLPIESNIIQATVVTNNCLDAEVSAKLCFFEDELPLLRGINSTLSYFLVTKDEKLIEGRVTSL